MSVDNKNVPRIDDTVAHTAVTVTGTSGAALAANDARRGCLLVNDSDTTMYVKLGATAVANEGIRINANGGALELNERVGPHFRGAINAIVATGSKTLLVTEW